MSNIKDIKIGKTDYKIQKLYPIDRSEVLFEIGQILNGGVEKFKGIDSQNISEMVSGVIDRMPPRESATLIKRLICLSVVQPSMDSEDGYNIHFQEFYEDQFVLIPEILAFNTGGIIPTLKKKFPIIGEFFQAFSWSKTKLMEESSE
jgi:hypothetical protein